MLLKEYLTSSKLWRNRVRDEASGARRWLWLYLYGPAEVVIVAGMLAACWVLEKMGVE